MGKDVWCVQHRDGWCAVKGGRKPSDTENSVPTRCGQFVVLPLSVAKREPTCGECSARNP